MTRTLYTDGSPKGRIAIVIPGNSPESESKVVAIPADTTNNEAEYMAIIESLKYIDNYIKSTGDESPWMILSDSNLAIMQSSGLWKCRAENLIPYLQQVQYYVDNLPVNIEFKWVSRDDNPAGILLEDILNYERQVNKEMQNEQETGRIRPYARKLFREL